MTDPQLSVNAHVVDLARGWIGTPYHHQASLKGIGCDCLGLVRGVWRELYGQEPEVPPAYSPDWGQVSGEETLLAAAKRHFAPVPIDALEPGHVVIFRMRPKAIAKHCGIISGPGRMIHALEGTGVCEVGTVYWLNRFCAGFSFS
ncbi:C40 family peptidase [Labrenzia sp. R4_1]|uniref:NlpC/P60 family protein n=1 Tax=Labrenzia sp. R4_1 TaxID=2821106 RepID=UPI001ADC92F3|nr:NlpC/P60 family protein [Labrenzia sp. R4_1]MBO9426972.1 C40 family peptidase [Labrenzia sp. R4_1]